MLIAVVRYTIIIWPGNNKNIDENCTRKFHSTLSFLFKSLINSLFWCLEALIISVSLFDKKLSWKELLVTFCYAWGNTGGSFLVKQYVDLH